MNTSNTLNHSQKVATAKSSEQEQRSKISEKHSTLWERRGESNTPFNSQDQQPQSCPVGGLSVRVDFIQCRGYASKIQPLMDFIQKFTGEGWSVRKDAVFSLNQHIKFDHVAKTPRCIKLAWTEVVCELTGEKLYDYWLSIPGQSWAQMDLIDQYRFISGLFFVYSAHGTRFDIALDDYKRRVSPEKVRRAVNRGDFAHFRKSKEVRSRDVNGESSLTMYLGFGTRGIRRRGMAFYDALLVHGIDAYRQELRYRQGHAKKMFEGFARANFSEVFDLRFDAEDMDKEATMLAEKEISKNLAQMVVGAVDFLKRRKKGSDKREKNLDRCKRYGWWQSLIDDVGGMMTISVPTPKPVLERTVKWIERQVMKKLTMLRDGWGYGRFQSWFFYEMEKARGRYEEIDELTIDLIRCNSG